MLRAKYKTGLVFFPAFDWAIDPTHPEREERLLYTQDQVLEEGLFDIDGITELKPDPVAIKDIQRVHFCVPDVSEVTTESHLISAGGAKTIGMAVLDGQIERGFALVRPPGHHAERGRSMGFCLFNNIAVAARHAQQKHGLERVMIVDWDLHHGNGTQFSFYDSPETLYISTHQYPYYPGTGSLEEVGAGPGEGYTVNIPLPGGLGDEDYAAIFNDIVVPVGKAYDPQLILVSAGFDIYHGDPLGSMSVGPAGFSYMTRSLVQLAEEVCGGRILVTLEGGYNLKGQRDGALAVLSELLGSPLDDGTEFYLTDEEYGELADAHLTHSSIEQARQVAKKYWKM